IALFKAGSGLYNVGARQYPIEAGDVFLFAGNEPHYITRIHPGEQMLIMNLHVSRSFLCPPDAGAFDARYLRFFLARGDVFENRIPAGVKLGPLCRETLLSIEEDLAERGGQGLAKAKARLSLLLATLAEAYAPESAESRPEALPHQRLEEALRLIDERLTEPLSLEAIARAAGMSRTHFSAVFRRAYGITLWEYIVARRIQMAIDLLLTHEENILEVALRSGFNNTANFNRAFKKFTGKTPSAYRAESAGQSRG
ncbi:MAG TPA: AraC family transcriptional regulator, partial [Clostridia bacterium]|nr:AraC family transcriptional regulator [Clostridia bacterium]